MAADAGMGMDIDALRKEIRAKCGGLRPTMRHTPPPQSPRFHRQLAAFRKATAAKEREVQKQTKICEKMESEHQKLSELIESFQAAWNRQKKEKSELEKEMRRILNVETLLSEMGQLSTSTDTKGSADRFPDKSSNAGQQAALLRMDRLLDEDGTLRVCSPRTTSEKKKQPVLDYNHSSKSCLEERPNRVPRKERRIPIESSLEALETPAKHDVSRTSLRSELESEIEDIIERKRSILIDLAEIKELDAKPLEEICRARHQLECSASAQQELAHDLGRLRRRNLELEAELRQLKRTLASSRSECPALIHRCQKRTRM